MTTITRDKTHIRFEGHAEYAPIGQDIVCAGVSTLAFTLMSSLEDYPNKINVMPGCIDIYSYSDDKYDMAMIIRTFDVIWQGCLHLAEQYNDYVIAKEGHLD